MALSQTDLPFGSMNFSSLCAEAAAPGLSRRGRTTLLNTPFTIPTPTTTILTSLTGGPISPR